MEIKYAIYPVTVDGVSICPEGARKSIDGTKWICDYPELSPDGVEPLQRLTYEEALALMATAEWSGGDES